MPQLSTTTEGWNSGSVICAAAATNGTFPAIFASRFYPELYQSDGSIPDETATLPGIPSQHGYSTGGFVASNPFLGKWSEQFDAWWNDKMSSSGVDTNQSERSNGLSEKLNQLVALCPRIPAEEVLSRADDWWERKDDPRFLWVHLMEPHGPYLPGLDLGREIDLFKSYISVICHSKLDQNRPTWIDKHLKRLHYQCNSRLDRVLTPWLESHNNARIILTGDHGEEFDHGILRHARLYDETVRVPIVSNNFFDSLDNEGMIRQLDFAPSVLSELDIILPESWEGSQWTNGMQPQEMINGSPALERTWIGIRSKSWKIIRPYDWNEGFQESEAYHVASDQAEKRPKPESAAPRELRERLDDFIDRPTISQYLRSTSDMQTGFNSEVEDRLKELGYIE